MIYLGVYPSAITIITGPSVEKLVGDYQARLGAAEEFPVIENEDRH